MLKGDRRSKNTILIDRKPVLTRH